MSFSRKFRLAGLAVLGGSLLVACGGDNGETPLFPVPAIPAAKSAIVAPESTSACPITASSIQAFVIKGTAPAFNGTSFGTVGVYNYILAEVTANVDAKDVCASTIVDLKNAANANGLVTYKFDVVILIPGDAAKASGSLLYIVNNRTNTSTLENLNDGSSNNLFDNVAPVIPAAATGVVLGVGAGNGFLMKQGMTVVLSGWQGDRPSSLSGATAEISSSKKWYALGMTLPVAREASGAAITGTVQDEWIFGASAAGVFGTYYPRVSGSTATLTIQKRPTSTPIKVDSSLWTYTAGSGIAEGGNRTANGFGYVTVDRANVIVSAAYADALDAGSDKGSIYHFNYVGSDPKPMELVS